MITKAMLLIVLTFIISIQSPVFASGTATESPSVNQALSDDEDDEISTVDSSDKSTPPSPIDDDGEADVSTDEDDDSED